MRALRIAYDDAGPDALGRRRFTLTWREPQGVFRTEPSKTDGKPVGFRRGQCFFAVPSEILRGRKPKAA